MERPTALRVGCLWFALLASLAGMNACRPANRDALREIVQDQCAVHWQNEHRAAPCERINADFALLHDIKGGAHFLLIPTRTIEGLESAALLEPGSPNYFGAAWGSRDLLAAAMGHALSRDAIGLALNPRHARSQDQMHIHIECLRTDVADTLRRAAARIAAAWSPLEVGGRKYEALRVMGEELRVDPIAALAARPPAARGAMGDYTLVVAGMTYTEGPGFVLLAANGPAGELLLDPACAVAALP
jgi:CDP-diacylglycerol pyrophosphatase